MALGRIAPTLHRLTEAGRASFTKAMDLVSVRRLSSDQKQKLTDLTPVRRLSGDQKQMLMALAANQAKPIGLANPVQAVSQVAAVSKQMQAAKSEKPAAFKSPFLGIQKAIDYKNAKELDPLVKANTAFVRELLTARKVAHKEFKGNQAGHLNPTNQKRLPFVSLKLPIKQVGVDAVVQAKIAELSEQAKVRPLKREAFAESLSEKLPTVQEESHGSIFKKADAQVAAPVSLAAPAIDHLQLMNDLLAGKITVAEHLRLTSGQF